MDVAAWLQGLGLKRYVPAFRDHEIDWEALQKLTVEDLKDLGVVLGGHRRRLLDAIAALGAAVPAASPTAALRDALAPTDAERRQLTVMFCDLVGSTALSARLDPEDLRVVIAAYHRTVAEVIVGLDGFVAKYMGDGVLVYFGYPRAHEDDAERAVRAGRDRRCRPPRCQIRKVPSARRHRHWPGGRRRSDWRGLGAGTIGRRRNAEPRRSAASARRGGPHSYLRGYAAAGRQSASSTESLGAIEVKGLPAAVRAFRVLGESRVGSRFEALRSGETPLIGRDEELELLQRRWEQAKTGNGRVVLISAEPGIGKSRLAEAFRESIAGEPHNRLRYFCSPHHQDNALYPFTEQLERASRLRSPRYAPDEARQAGGVGCREPTARCDCAITGRDAVGAVRRPLPPLDLTPQRKKERTFEALLRQLAGLAMRDPVLMVFEDLHWADPTSRELLDLILEQIERLPVLLIATFRPEYQPPWTGQSHVTTLSLRRLGRQESDELVRGIIGNTAALPSEILVRNRRAHGWRAALP